MVKMFLCSRSEFFTLLACLLCFSVLVGCSEETVEKTGTVTGKVISDGKVVSNCRVMAFHVGTTRSSLSRVGEDGRYAFKEVPLGDYLFAILQSPSYEAEAAPFDERIAKKYRDINTSGFELSLKEGTSELDLELSQ